MQDTKPQKSTGVIEASSRAKELKESSFRIPSLNRNLESKENPIFLHKATDPSHGMQGKKLMEAARLLYTMMARDYHFKARRKPPINNHHPINDFYREP
ncbi:hypothetical protein HPP92_018529 [Vanilla planifolia]|uniref:Uncharacterized protein n=1 Tax=Vanilla planifolia TaxID=51239 RepID=A0A835QEA1_VANPL|nr:hypothetical protein HPP92_018529 [Vanilla planifolia]